MCFVETDYYQYYLIKGLKNTLDKDDLQETLFMSFGLIILFLVGAFFIVNWVVSKALWKPFYNTLTKLNQYDVKYDGNKRFETINTLEFNQLNDALNKMTDKLQAEFIQQKEFTENASHEMQTPLAIIKTNVSLLMQSKSINELEINQLQVIENSVKKLSSLNKTLLLLTKIDNNQFQQNTKVNLKLVVAKILEQYADFIEVKKLQVFIKQQTD